MSYSKLGGRHVFEYSIRIFEASMADKIRQPWEWILIAMFQSKSKPGRIQIFIYLDKDFNSQMFGNPKSRIPSTKRSAGNQVYLNMFWYSILFSNILILIWDSFLDICILMSDSFFRNLKIFSISWSDIYEEVFEVTAVATN